ncbi:MAG: branched-chain amino acid ABC transporter substrate-binding protein [Betaproteobacteria bacterium]|nr:branched-chain amino acid ABC transporter substrate-binding protein [Betaproteobacteria bacterium]
MIASLLRFACVVLCGMGLMAGSTRAADPIRVALIEPLSGPFANIGQSAQYGFQWEFDRLNAQGGVLNRKYELIPLDNKSNPQETGLQVQAAISRGAKFIIQGAGSNNAHAGSEAVAKHNARNPDKLVIYLNHGALDPALTEEKCHYWHFRFAPHGHMIMEAVTDAVARNPAIKRIYIINQDYVWGHSVAKDAKSMLARKRPDIQVVGEDLHALGKVKDFAPYIAKVAAAKADAIVTGNWGNDLALLVKAANATRLTTQVYAPMAGLPGAPAAIGAAGAGRVHSINFWHPNIENTPFLPQANAFKAKYKIDYSWLPNHALPQLLNAALRKAGNDDPAKVAAALRTVRFKGPTGEVWLRAEDHQIIMPIYATLFVKAGQPGAQYDAENTTFGWKTEGYFDAAKNPPPVLCRVTPP